ncbi:hypothetical protein [Geodermatophilus sabuli]|jgi:predicted nucleic acid-binding Zn ribbon protein|uniref:Uncharacterized protein n=1 Tax=Geodermatophilus sabuli TaxID=1564158 RepID=A0A285E7U3_9ACTN|nr:hypothetical protein [Geodermatophilus sabuli]MBB3081930.1 putative nucleic acid-binding Zn ribbon protein [Geodermatophilus sabuli]SNX95198.1 hypothetical protein SAMN06893097_1011006 [Geodermatophilus sabuli]
MDLPAPAAVVPDGELALAARRREVLRRVQRRESAARLSAMLAAAATPV